MAKCMKLDDTDKAALRKLDDFTIAPDGETATITGAMTVEIYRPVLRPDSDQFWLTITLPKGDELNVRMDRASLLMATGIEADEEA